MDIVFIGQVIADMHYVSGHLSVELVSDIRCQWSISFFTTFSLETERSRHQWIRNSISENECINFLLFLTKLEHLTSKGSISLSLSPRGVVSDDGALLLSQVARPPGVESLQEQVNVPSPIHLQTLIDVTGINWFLKFSFSGKLL